MAHPSLEQHVHPFLEKLSERHRLLVMSGIRPFSREPGEYLIREGEQADTLFLIRAGHGMIETSALKRPPVPVQRIGPDCVVGWSWLLPPYRWQFSCRAEDSIEGLAIDSSWLLERCEEDFTLDNHLYRNLIEAMGERLTALRLQCVRSATNPSEEQSDQKSETSRTSAQQEGLES